MILKYSSDSSNLANELENSLNSLLNNDNKIDNNIELTINNLIRSAELFDELQNYKAAEIITKVIEKLALKNGK